MKKLINKFPTPVILAHWITLVLVLIAYFSSQSPIQDQSLGQIHVLAGGLVFVFFLIRVILYFTYRLKFPTALAMSYWQEKAFQLMKVALYLCLFAVPLVGWFALSSMQTEFHVLGLSLPLITMSSTALIGELHQVIVNIFITLVGLHAFAALFHHFILKDDVLKSMR